MKLSYALLGSCLALGHVIDMMPTCLDVAGAEYPRTRGDREIIPVEGKSLLPIFEGGTRKGHAALFWEQERGMRAVREGNWKLVARDHGEWELYDLAHDGTELNDLAPTRPDRVVELAETYDAWAQRCGVVPWESR